MSPDVKQHFARMVAARKRLIDLRAERMEQLLSVRTMLRLLLADFTETLDPITNLRLAEVAADGSKTHGDLAIVLGFFEGTKLRVAVDVQGRFSHSVSIPSAFDDVQRVVEIRVASDYSRAEVTYEPVGASGAFATLDLGEVALGLLAHAVAAVEAQIPTLPSRSVREAPLAARVAATGASSVAGRAGLVAPRLVASVGSAASRLAAAAAGSGTPPPLHLSIAEPTPGAETFVQRPG